MKCRHWSLIVGVAIFGWSSAGAATDLFGVALHRPLSTSQCAERLGAYLPDDREQCFKWPEGAVRSDATPADGEIIVNVPLQERPDFMSGADVVVGLKDGVVVSVSARTHGTPRAEEDYHALEEVFGRADPSYQTMPGNDFSTILANWPLPDGDTVYFNSGEFGPYYGLVRIQTSSARPHQPGVWD